MKKKKETRGGTRKNAGAKPKYSEQTKTVAFRCPVSKVDELKLIVKSKLSEWSVKLRLIKLNRMTDMQELTNKVDDFSRYGRCPKDEERFE